MLAYNESINQTKGHNMKIKVWGASPICSSFEELNYYNGNPQEVAVHGLSSLAERIRDARAKKAAKYDDEITKAAIMTTGMTPEEYQKYNKIAWNA